MSVLLILLFTFHSLTKEEKDYYRHSLSSFNKESKVLLLYKQLVIYSSTTRPQLVYYSSTTRPQLLYYSSTTRLLLVYHSSTTRLPLLYYSSTTRLLLVYYSSTTRSRIGPLTGLLIILLPLLKYERFYDSTNYSFTNRPPLVIYSLSTRLRLVDN